MRINPLGKVAGAFCLDRSEIACILGPVGCLPAETEYLSPSGWRRMDSYDKGLVAMWGNDELTFVKPSGYIDAPCTEPMLEFKNVHALHMVLSSNHRMPLYDWKGSFCVRTAQQVFDKPSRYRVPVNFETQRGLGLTENEIRLRVMVSADGHYPKAGRQCSVTVRKERKKDRLRWLLDACGIEYREVTHSSRPTETVFTFKRPEFSKGLGVEWFRASSEELAVLLDEMQYWDGLFEGPDMRFSTSKKLEADVVQFAAHANGLRASICVNVQDAKWTTNYTVHICRGAKAKVRLRGDSVERSTVTAKRQYCFTVPSGFFLARHNGRVFVTGNSGKSTASCLRLMQTAIEQTPGPYGIARSRFVIVRNTNRMLQDTTIRTWLDVFPEKVWGAFEKTKMMHRIRASINGKAIEAEFHFRPLENQDDIRNLLSAEYTGAWLNEFREIDPEIVPHLSARCGRFPNAESGGCKWSGIIADTNPWPSTSQYHDWFVVNPREGYRFFHQPGGMDADAENLHNLAQTPQTKDLAWNDPVRIEQGRTYYKKLLRDYSPEEADMYVHAKYGASRAGKPVFVSYADNTHCKPFELDKNAPLLIGYDNTGRNPAAVVSQKTNVGQWRIRWEFIGEGVGVKAHATALKSFLEEQMPGFVVEKITCDPAGRAKGADDLDMPTVIRNVFKGVLVVNARTNDPATRIEAVDGTFRRMINGEPAVLIHPDCKVLRAACIHEYHYRKMKVSGKERYAEEPEKNHPYADVADALEYLMLGGGEGRASAGTNTQADWAARGQAIQPSKIWTPFDR